VTLIASYALDNFPLVFGDLLITGDMLKDRIVSVPTQGEVQDFFGDSGWGISGLKQKVNIISDTCVIAWAGNWLGARVAISGLRELAKKKELIAEEILSFLSTDPDLAKFPADFVGLVCEEKGLRLFHYGAEEFTGEALGTAYLAGTGAEAVRHFDEILRNSALNTEGAIDYVALSIAKSLMMGGLLLQAELHGELAAPSLLNMFGGGYEIAYFADGRMQKIPEITFLFWDIKILAEGCEISAPKLVVKQTYLRDYLLIRSVLIGKNDNAEPAVLADRRHAVSPMYEPEVKPTEADLLSLTLVSALRCHCIIVHDGSETLGLKTLVLSRSATSLDEVVFSEVAGDFSMQFRVEFLENLSRSVESFWSK